MDELGKDGGGPVDGPSGGGGRKGGGDDIHLLHDDIPLPDGIRRTPDSSGDGRHYMYREGEFLCLTDDMPLIQDKLAANGWREPISEERVSRDEALTKFGITRCLAKDVDEDIPKIVELLRVPVVKRFPDGEDREVSPRVYPDVAIPLQYHASWHPAGPRRPASPLGKLPRRRFFPLPGHGVKVGVLDTGMPAAPMGWFDGRCDSGQADRDPLGPGGSGPLTPTDGHGRFIAGIVLQHAPGAKVIVRRLPDHFDDWVTDSDLAPAIVSLANEGVDIINLSVSGSTHDQTGLGTTQAAVEGLRETHPNLVVVVAAGNSGVDAKFYPASLANVISVGAINTDDDGRPGFSNFGEWVNASAPGVDVHSIFVKGTDSSSVAFDGFATWTGTSFAAPQVAAAIATRVSPGGWRQYVPFLRAKTAFAAAFALFADPGLPWVRGSGKVVRPKSYLT